MSSPSAFPWRVLARPLAPRDRRALGAHLRALLAWHETLERWPAVPAAPDAMPFVSLYAQGRVRGCFGSAEGAPGERIARAFLRAATDARFGGVPAGAASTTVASVSYARAPRRALRGDDVLAVLEPGTHGVVLVQPGAPATVLLPQVARDGSLDGPALLATLARKAGLEPDEWRVFDVLLFEAETVSSRDEPTATRQPTARGAMALAAAWLARQVGTDGAVGFSLDAATGARQPRGPMFHGRASTVVQALAAHGGHGAVVARARKHLGGELRAALDGRAPESWPDDPSMVAGALALAVLAGIDVRRDLLALVRESAAATRSPWHAAQVAAVLGGATPAHAWRTAVDDLSARPFAPWTLMAAHARGAAAVTARCERALADALRVEAPHAGGAAFTEVPEVALTAVAVEALVPLAPASPRARAAVARGREFLRRWQFLPGHVPAALDPALALGAFPASPVHYGLRCDITAHALLALRD